MKMHFITALIATVSLSSVLAEDIVGETDKWNLGHPAYAQMKIVPTKETETAMGRIYGKRWEAPEWDGPWKPFSRFQIRVGYSKGEQLKPNEFHFVQPLISLEGFSQNSNESHSRTVTLFEGPAKAIDIKMRAFPLEGTPTFNLPIKVASLFSERQNLSWDIYVRFTDNQPARAKAKE